MVKIAVNGASGRMGQRILALAKERSQDFNVTQAFDLGGSLENLLPYVKGEKKLSCDVLIDFSGPDGAQWCVDAAYHSKKALVIGSTGLNNEIREKIKTASAIIPIVESSNMSVGVNVMLALVAEAAKKLSDDFNIQITEAHHIQKKDAPSGTALMLADSIAKAKGWDIATLLKTWKEGRFDSRGSKEKIGMRVIRQAEVVVDHTVFFEGPAETIEIKHHADSRDTFARGALTAALFLSKKDKGLYTMADVLR